MKPDTKNCLEARLIGGKLRCVKHAQSEAPEIDDAALADGGLGFIADFGYPGELNPAYGALAGGAAAVAGSIAAKMLNHKSSPHSKYSGLYGLGAGLAVGGAMAMFHSTRRAGYLAMAVAAVEAAGDLITTLYVEPKQLAGWGIGMYDTSFAGAGDQRIEILGNPEDGMYGPAALGEGGIQILGQSSPPAIGASPMDVMGGLGLYQPEMTGAFNPYGGTF